MGGIPSDQVKIIKYTLGDFRPALVLYEKNGLPDGKPF
jgi:hypothetical protein